MPPSRFSAVKLDKKPLATLADPRLAEPLLPYNLAGLAAISSPLEISAQGGAALVEDRSDHVAALRFRWDMDLESRRQRAPRARRASPRSASKTTP